MNGDASWRFEGFEGTPSDPIASTERHFAEVTAEHGLGPTALDTGRFFANQAPPQSGFEALMNNAIESRRALENERNDLINRIPYTRDKKQMSALTARLHGLDRDEQFNQWLAGQHRLQAHTDALESDKELKRQRDTRIDSQADTAMKSMMDLENALHSGEISNEEFSDGLMQIRHDNFEGVLHHPEASKHWDALAFRADKLSEEMDRENIRGVARFAAKYGIPPQADESGNFSMEATRAAAMQTPKGQAEAMHTLNTDLLNRYGIGTGVASLMQNSFGGTADLSDPKNPKFTPTDPTDPNVKQTHVQIQSQTAQGATHSVILPKEHFDQIKAEYEPQYLAITGAGGQPRPAATPVPSAPASHPQDSAALDWARSNPGDPRAARILSLNQ